MSNMRKDIFTDRWVIVAEGDGLQPTDFHFKKFARDTGFCPFCDSNEATTPKEVFAIRNPGSSPNGPGWSVRVVPNSRPLLRIEGQLGRRAEALHDLMNGVGAHEIIAETSRHDRSLHELEIEEISNVIRAYLARILDLEGDQHVRYVLIFKNHGEAAGAHTISHSISQLVALPVTPRAVKTKLMIARDYFALKERCIYCDVLQQESKGRKRLITENKDFVAFAPFASRFPFVLQKLDQKIGGPPYNLSLHDRPFLRPRRDYWKTIEEDFHWHIEILPQMSRITGFEWASGFFYNPVPPEVAARCLSPDSPSECPRSNNP